MKDDAVFKLGVLFTSEEVFGDKEEHSYNVECRDGIGLATICKGNGPIYLRVTYPKLADVLADDAMSQEVLSHFGLYETARKDINYGDIMLRYGKVEVCNVMSSLLESWDDGFAEFIECLGKMMEDIRMGLDFVKSRTYDEETIKVCDTVIGSLGIDIDEVLAEE